MGWMLRILLVILLPLYLSFKPFSREGAVEICDNAIDDDLDGLIDLNDPDCNCEVAEPKSLIPNPSFEEKSCCPSNRGSLNCADTWIQASEATTDYIHECGWFGWEDLPVPTPLPDGQACIGFRNGRFGDNSNPNWKEYTGACLTSPLKAGTSYKFQFWLGFTNFQNSPPLNVVFYGSTDCKYLPFGIGDERFGCPLNGEGWLPLDATFGSGSNNWTLKEFNVTPDQDIYAIAIGPDCNEQNLTENPYYFLDNLVLADVKEFELVIGPSTHPCDPKFSLILPLRETNRYQWYRNGVALLGETDHELKTPLQGVYQVRVIDQNGKGTCKVTKPYTYTKPSTVTTLHKHLCIGNTLDIHGRSVGEPGSYLDTFKTVNYCDSIIETVVEMVNHSYVDLHAKIFSGETYEVGGHQFSAPTQESVLLKSRYGCDSTVNLHLEYYQVYIPNAISPNGDGINDGFSIYGSNELISIKSLELYNKWGNRVFSGSNLLPNQEILSWQNSNHSSDVYTYTVELIMDDGNPHHRSGSFLLLR